MNNPSYTRFDNSSRRRRLGRARHPAWRAPRRAFEPTPGTRRHGRTGGASSPGRMPPRDPAPCPSGWGVPAGGAGVLQLRPPRCVSDVLHRAGRTVPPDARVAGRTSRRSRGASTRCPHAARPRRRRATLRRRTRRARKRSPALAFTARGEDFVRRHLDTPPLVTPIAEAHHRFLPAGALPIPSRNQMRNRPAMAGDRHRFAVLDRPQQLCQARLGLGCLNFTHATPLNRSFRLA